MILGKRNEMQGLLSILSLFRNKFFHTSGTLFSNIFILIKDIVWPKLVDHIYIIKLVMVVDGCVFCFPFFPLKFDKSKEEGKDHESIQPSIPPDRRHHMGK